MQVQMIAMDMDGTLLDRQGRVPEENIKALKEAQAQGIIVTVCSGRYPENAWLVMQGAGIECPIIGSNGACIIDEQRRILASHAMADAAKLSAYAYLEAVSARYYFFGEHFVCTSEEKMAHYSEVEFGDKLPQQMGVTVYHGRDATQQMIHRLVHKFFVHDNGDLPLMRRQLSPIAGISLTQSGEHNLEIMPEGIDKGTGIRELAAHYGISIENVMALGDQENDIPMLSIAGYGVAMGNASAAAKAAAKYATAAHDQAGVAKAIYRFALA